MKEEPRKEITLEEYRELYRNLIEEYGKLKAAKEKTRDEIQEEINQAREYHEMEIEAYKAEINAFRGNSMIKKFVQEFEDKKEVFKELYSKKHPEAYKDIIVNVAAILDTDMDATRIHEINDGEYEGTLLYVIAEKRYTPSVYWYVKVAYGSCSGCDTLQDIRGRGHEAPTQQQIDDYMTLTLHIVQGLKRMED